MAHGMSRLLRKHRTPEMLDGFLTMQLFMVRLLLAHVLIIDFRDTCIGWWDEAFCFLVGMNITVCTPGQQL